MILHLIFIYILLGPNKKIKCSKNQFSCQNNNQCIDILEYCNNRINCDDESDEINCSTNHCDNYNTNCHKWSLWGYCDKSYKYMLENCRKSCDYCPTTTYTTIPTNSNTYTTYTTNSNTYTTIKTTSNTYTTTSNKYNASRKIDYQNDTSIIKSKKRKSTSTIIIVILVICIIFLIFINKKKSIVYENDINENDINENDINENDINQPDNFLKNENINNNKPIILDSVYNSMYCNENNDYLVPVVQNSNYIEEGEYEEIV